MFELDDALRVADESELLQQPNDVELSAYILGAEVRTLRARVVELEAEREATGTEWGVRYPSGAEELALDERHARCVASVRPGRTVVTRTAAGLWRVTT